MPIAKNLLPLLSTKIFVDVDMRGLELWLFDQPSSLAPSDGGDDLQRWHRSRAVRPTQYASTANSYMPPPPPMDASLGRTNSNTSGSGSSNSSRGSIARAIVFRGDFAVCLVIDARNADQQPQQLAVQREQEQQEQQQEQQQQRRRRQRQQRQRRRGHQYVNVGTSELVTPAVLPVMWLRLRASDCQVLLAGLAEAQQQ